jgi:hypothetical protein
MRAAAVAICSFSFRWSFSFSRCVGSSNAPSRIGSKAPPCVLCTRPWEWRENIKVLPDCHLGRLELLGQVHDQNPSVAVQHLENFSLSFFVQHLKVPLTASNAPFSAQRCSLLWFYLLTFLLPMSAKWACSNC